MIVTVRTNEHHLQDDKPIETIETVAFFKATVLSRVNLVLATTVLVENINTLLQETKYVYETYYNIVYRKIPQ